MTSKVDYTNSEWNLLKQAITLIWIIVTASDLTLFSALKEVFAFTQKIKNAKLNYQDNQLIQDLLADISDEEEETKINEIETAENFEDFLEDALKKLKAAVAIAQIKATQKEAQEYTEFLYEIAIQIANASGEGMFGTGPKVSKKEAIVLEQLKIALNLA
ncbi:MAG: hypothetical protein WBA93_27865 [Microcoleaceae cyanobacterium]